MTTITWKYYVARTDRHGFTEYLGECDYDWVRDASGAKLFETVPAAIEYVEHCDTTIIDEFDVRQVKLIYRDHFTVTIGGNS